MGHEPHAFQRALGRLMLEILILLNDIEVKRFEALSHNGLSECDSYWDEAHDILSKRLLEIE